nr:hypothetical protein [Armatimonadota bacterium]NIO74910.1 hypothetical protein [Armatimonadota bacterium]NIO96611.1 hypothetical protein [Armatimonadota bacterium]
ARHLDSELIAAKTAANQAPGSITRPAAQRIRELEEEVAARDTFIEQLCGRS